MAQKKKKSPRAIKKRAARGKRPPANKVTVTGQSLRLAAKQADLLVRRSGQVYIEKATELEAARIERREAERALSAYYSAEAKRIGRPFYSFLAQGDSWFDYTAGRGQARSAQAPDRLSAVAADRLDVRAHYRPSPVDSQRGTARVPQVFLSDPSQPHRAAHAPGDYFHYCNTGFELLGHLACRLDGRELPELLRARILEPLGMTRTEPSITLDMRPRLVESYASFQSDRPEAPSSRLCAAPGIIFTSGAGCIASTAHDMGGYVRMLANRGLGPKGHLVSQESVALFSAAHIKADEFGPTASYGYGIAVDRLDGHTVVRHTGGMVSFASAILVDLDAGVGAFASVNAMQGYRPTPVVQFAARLMRARGAKQPLPAIPSLGQRVVRRRFVHGAARVQTLRHVGQLPRTLSQRESLDWQHAGGATKGSAVVGRGDSPGGGRRSIHVAGRGAQPRMGALRRDHQRPLYADQVLR